MHDLTFASVAEQQTGGSRCQSETGSGDRRTTCGSDDDRPDRPGAFREAPEGAELLFQCRRCVFPEVHCGQLSVGRFAFPAIQAADETESDEIAEIERRDIGGVHPGRVEVDDEGLDASRPGKQAVQTPDLGTLATASTADDEPVLFARPQRLDPPPDVFGRRLHGLDVDCIEIVRGSIDRAQLDEPPKLVAALLVE
ncbi:hypothetical protein L6V77_24615 [Myxococcota bacterium]|nr:hypothetical protein [Myxococcota bacterium]